MSKHEMDDDVGPVRTVRTAKPVRAVRRLMTLETLNAVSSATPDFDPMDFAALDEPREPEKWY